MKVDLTTEEVDGLVRLLGMLHHEPTLEPQLTFNWKHAEIKLRDALHQEAREATPNSEWNV